MKVKTLTRSTYLSENVVKSIKIYFGLFSEKNIILNIKNINEKSVLENSLLMFIENNEEVNSFSYENKTLSISLK